jgi:hypothetical protein
MNPEEIEDITEVETYELLHHKEEADACNKAFVKSDGE